MKLLVHSKTGFIALAIHTVLVTFMAYACGIFAHLNDSMSGEDFFQFFFATIFDLPIFIIWQLVVLVPGPHFFGERSDNSCYVVYSRRLYVVYDWLLDCTRNLGEETHLKVLAQNVGMFDGGLTPENCTS